MATASQEIHIGERIRWFRTQAGMKQQELADKLGMTRAAVSAMELGKNGVKATTLRAIADALNTTVELMSSEAAGQAMSLVKIDNLSLYKPERNLTARNILSNVPIVRLRRLPFSGRASFNFPQLQRHQNTEVFDEVEFRIPKGRVPADYTDALVVDIEGDSMEPSLYDGQSVIAWPIPEGKWEQLHNTICLVDYDDTATVKAVFKNDLFTHDCLTLHATGGRGGEFTVARAAIHSIWEVREFYDPVKVRLIR